MEASTAHGVMQAAVSRKAERKERLDDVDSTECLANVKFQCTREATSTVL